MREAATMCLFGSVFPSVCLLDDNHIKAELALVDYAPSDESPASLADIRALLSRHQFAMSRGGRRAAAQNGLESDGLNKSQWRSLIRNFTEDDLITSIDDNGLSMTVQILMDILWSCRKSYSTLRPAPPVDPFLHAFVDLGAEKGVHTQDRRKLQSSRAPYDVLAWDAKGRRAEFALYSRRKVLNHNGKRISEFEAWAPKPKPVDLPFSSRINSDLYIWKPSLEAESKSVDQSNPHGPVAILNPVDVAALNEQRNTPSRGENILWTAAETIIDG
jgi:hypothetical protein